jgi:hypothetical protein
MAGDGSGWSWKDASRHEPRGFVGGVGLEKIDLGTTSKRPLWIFVVEANWVETSIRVQPKLMPLALSPAGSFCGEDVVGLHSYDTVALVVHLEL